MTILKLKRFQKVAWIRSHHLHLQWKFKLWAGKFAWGVNVNFWKLKVCWHHPAMFCHITSCKLSRQKFEFSLKVKVMRWNPGYLLKYFLLYFNIDLQSEHQKLMSDAFDYLSWHFHPLNRNTYKETIFWKK